MRSPNQEIGRKVRWQCTIVALTWALGCGIAPVRWDDSTEPPPRWTYAGVHGKPLAFGGGVCALDVKHRHNYPPSPREAFEDTAAGLFDTRPVWPFFGTHPHHGRTCHVDRWHLHLEPPDPGLAWRDDKAAWARGPAP